jgi:hypothetical protein
MAIQISGGPFMSMLSGQTPPPPESSSEDRQPAGGVLAYQCDSSVSHRWANTKFSSSKIFCYLSNRVLTKPKWLLSLH